jgi:hypothetical protein
MNKEWFLSPKSTETQCQGKKKGTMEHDMSFLFKKRWGWKK